MWLKRLLLILLIVCGLFRYTYAIDPIIPVFHMLGADNSQVGHFVSGELFCEWLEGSFGLEPWQSLIAVYLLAEAKEQIDIMTGTFRDGGDVKWTCLGWGARRVLTIDFRI